MRPRATSRPHALRGLLTLVVIGGAFAAFRLWSARRQHVEQAEFRASPTFWADNGFVEMVPPLRLPGRAATGLETSVWLRLPSGSVLRVSGEHRLIAYPAGAEAVRVETFRDANARVADARGINFLAENQQQFYVLKPSLRGSGNALHGFAWARDDAAAQAQATRLIGDFARGNGTGPAADAAATRAAAQNACVRCHVKARPEARRVGEFAEVARGTDADGLFQIQTVLTDHAPIENYAPREQNAGDPNVTVRCGELPARERATALGPVFECADGQVPIGYFDVAQALKSGDSRARGLCRARRYLFEHLEHDTRRLFGAAFSACGI